MSLRHVRANPPQGRALTQIRACTPSAGRKRRRQRRQVSISGVNSLLAHAASTMSSLRVKERTSVLASLVRMHKVTN